MADRLNVKGLSGITRVVTLFPKQTCNCPSTEIDHIAAAKLCVDMPMFASQKKNFSLSQLRRNNRSRKEKKSGRKRPRPNDIDLEGKTEVASYRNRCVL